MLIPVLILSGGALIATYRVFRSTKVVGMTPERVKIYQAALVTLKDPVKLERLAQAFEKEGCTAEARLLRQRAKLRALPKEVKAARRDAFARAIKSSNVDAIRKVAAAFAGEGATGAAANLRRHADSLVTEAEMLKIFTEPAKWEPDESEEEVAIDDEPVDEGEDLEPLEEAAEAGELLGEPSPNETPPEPPPAA